MSKILLCCGLALFANACAISVGAGPVAPGPQVAYLPPATAHSTPTPAATQPVAQPAAQPAATPAPQPERHQPAAVRAEQPAPQAPPASGMRQTKAAEPKQKKKLRFKDIWVEQTDPKFSPGADPAPTPVGRLAKKP